jgi:hypothetical protein
MRYSVGIQFTLKLNPGNTPLPVATSTITGSLFLQMIIRCILDFLYIGEPAHEAILPLGTVG